MKKEPSLLTILGISVCLLAALYLPKNITDKTTYKSCIDSLANAFCKYQNTKYNKKDSNQPCVSEKVNPPIEVPQLHTPLLKGESTLNSGSVINSRGVSFFVDEISDTKQQSLPRFCFSNTLEEVAAIAFPFAVVLFFLFVLYML